MKNIFKWIGVLTLSISIYSCNDNYFDVNTPSNAVSADKIAMKDVLSPCIQYTMNAQFNAASNIALVDQHITTLPYPSKRWYKVTWPNFTFAAWSSPITKPFMYKEVTTATRMGS